MSDNDVSSADPFGQIADEFVEAIRQGQRPSVEEFARRYPEHAADIREMLPALVLMEKAKAPDHAATQRRAAVATPLQQLGDYQILREVGRGGMGVVYEAQQLSLGRHVAIKVLPAHALLDSRHLARFQREARSAAKLHHTNIVPVFGVGEQDGLHYYVMQFIQGLGLDLVLDELRRLRQPRGKEPPAAAEAPSESTPRTRDVSAEDVARSLLTGGFRRPEPSGDVTTAAENEKDESRKSAAASSLISRRSSPSSSATVHLPGKGEPSTLSESGGQYWVSVARIGMQVADALAHAASQGILHRDIKPSNLLLDETGNVWVTDFGLAKAAGDGDDLTHTGDIVGTLRYMAPERFNGQGDLRSDVYSLGLTLYELLALRPAFDETNRNRLVKQVMDHEPVRPRKLNPHVPRDLETVVLKAIARDPSHRYQTPAEMAEDLKCVVEDRPVRARRISDAERLWRWTRRNPLPAALAAGIVLVFLAGFAGVYWQWREAERNAKRAAQSQKETAGALAKVESQKAEVEGSLTKTAKAERSARAAEETGRKLLYTTDMRLAPFVWSDDRSTAQQLRVLLAKHIPERQPAGRSDADVGEVKPDLRGFEWRYYQHLLESSAAVFSGHSVPVVDGGFSANGKLVTLDQNGQVRRWDLDSQNEEKASRRDLPGGASAQLRVLSPNGRMAALAKEAKVHVFDASTGKETFQADSANDRSRRLIFSRDNDRLVVLDNKIRWFNAVSGEVIATVDQEFERVSCLALSADGLTLAVVGHSLLGNQFSVFRLDPTARKATPLAKDVNAGGTSSAAALSADGRWIAVGAKLSGTLFVYDTAKGGLIAKHGSAHASPIAALAFSGDGARLATADTEGTIKLWGDARKLTSKTAALRTLKGNQGAIHSVAFSIDGKRLVTTSADRTARVWDLENSGASIRPLERAGSSAVARFSPDGQLIAAADGVSVRLWDAATGQLVRELTAGDKGRVHSVAFSPSDPRLLATGYGGHVGVSYVALWDIDAGKEVARLPGVTDLPGFQDSEYSGAVGALAFSPDGRYLAAGFGAKQLYSRASHPTPLKVWEVAGRRLVHRLDGHTGYCVSVAFSRDGTLLASGSRDGTAILWSTETWKATQTLPNPDKDTQFGQATQGMVEDVAFSPDGKILALASHEGTVQLWDVAAGKLQDALKGHSSAVTAVVFSPDGRTLASSGTDQAVRLWNMATRRELMQLDAGNVDLGGATTLAFSPDGAQLLAGGRNTTAFWSAAPSVWNDPDRAAEQLRLLLHSSASIPDRIRMLSENLRLHEALERLAPNDGRVQTALAAAQANWHASRKAWPEAVLAFDRLAAAQSVEPAAWLRTPGLLRVATALLEQGRPGDAATLLQGGATRRTQDGLPPISQVKDFGLKCVVEDGVVRITGLQIHSPAASSGLRPGDILVKANGVALTKATIPTFENQILEGQGTATTLHLTVRHPDGARTEDVTLEKATYRVDDATGELFFPLQAALEKRLAENSSDAGLHELSAELAGQEADFARQAAGYTAAIKILKEQPAETAAARLRRLHRRRGDVHIHLQAWREAVDDYAHVITPETTDRNLLANRARAQEGLKNWEAAAADWARAATDDREGARLLAEFARRLVAAGEIPLANAPFDRSQAHYERLLAADPARDAIVAELAQLVWDRRETEWTVIRPTEMISREGVTLTLQSDGSILASGKNPANDAYTLVAPGSMKRIRAIRFEALPDSSLPQNGPGRIENGNFGLAQFRVFVGNKQVTLTNCAFDYIPPGENALKIIHGNGGWSVFLREGERHVALFQTDVTLSEEQPLRFEIENERLGRFRLSVSENPAVFDRDQKRFSLTDPLLKLAVHYGLSDRNEEAAQYFARALERLDSYEAKKPIVELAARFEHVLSVLSKRLPEDPQLLTALARLHGQRGKQRLAEKKPAEAQAELEKLRDIVTRLHAAYPEPQWTVLTPVEMKSETGAKLELQKDGSVFVLQRQPANNDDAYTLMFQSDLKAVRGLRLEVLTDPRLPHGGPGWGENGNFLLNELSVQAAPAGNSDKAKAIALRNAWADFSQVHSGYWGYVGGTVFGSARGWGVYPQQNQNHTAVFDLAEEVGDGQATRLTVRLKHQRNDHRDLGNLGRFRLSLTNDPKTLPATRIRLDLQDNELRDFYAALDNARTQQGRTRETAAPPLKTENERK
jgi:WD40 repeat protein/serine/threonine protein kinase